jgi:hypothetical protein
MLGIKRQAQLVRFNGQLRAVRKIVPNPAAAYDEDYFKCFCDFGSYVSRYIAFSILVVAELSSAHAHFSGKLLLGYPGCLSSLSDL